jgi:competence protein ComEC
MQTKEGTIARQIPCFMTLSSFPPLTGSYQIEGVLEKKEGYFLFSPEPDLAWVPIKRSISLVHLRWKASSFMRDQLHRLFEDPSLAHFFTALTLGTNEDRMLRFHFGKLGLQHILAISGFHFGLIALLIGGFLKVFCKKDSLCLPLLFVILTGYFLFLGSSPSILRAYIAISLYLLARWKGWPTDGLNLLGAALLLELLIAPKSLTHLGFQLSFLSTFAILLFTPITLKWTEKLFPKRSSIQLWIERPIYLFCCLLRSTLALNLAVMLFVVPVCLFYFHKFPLSSLLYNLFIPLATSMSLYLFFLSLPFFWLFPPLGSFLHGINTAWTGTLLSLVFESPSWLDVSLRISWISLPLLLLVMVSLSVYGIDRRAQKGLHP